MSLAKLANVRPEPPKITVRRSARRRWSAAETARRLGPGQSLERLKLSRLTIEGDLDLRGVALRGELELADVVLRGRLRLDEARLAAGLSLRGVLLEGGLCLDHARVDGDLRIASLRLGEDLRGRGLIVSGELLTQGITAPAAAEDRPISLDLRDAEVQGGVELHGIRLPGDLLLDDAALGGWTDLSGLEARRLGLRRLRLDSGFELHHAHLRQDLEAGELQAAEDVSLRDSRIGAELDLRRGIIGGRLDVMRLDAKALRLDGARLSGGALAAELTCGELTAPAAEVEAAIELRAARIAGDVHLDQLLCENLDLAGARIAGSLGLSGAELGELRLEDTVIGGDLGLEGASLTGVSADRVSCRGDARLVGTDILGSLDARDAIFDRRLCLRPRSLFGPLRLSGTRAAHPDLDASGLCDAVEPTAVVELEEAAATVSVLAGWLESQNDYAAMDAMRLRGHALRRRRRSGVLGGMLSLLEWLLVALPTGYGLRPGRVAASLIALGLSVGVLAHRHPAAFGQAELGLRDAVGIGLGAMSGRPLGLAPLPDSPFAFGLPLAGLIGVLLTALLVGSLTRVLAR